MGTLAARSQPVPRDLILIGASAGGVETVSRLLCQLPGTLGASVLIVVHQSADRPSRLAGVFQRATMLPVDWAQEGQPLEPGRVHLAPPGLHLVVDESRMHLIPGPLENRSRPSINRLFRSAAVHRGGRSIGVVLTGMLDDGAVGLAALKSAGAVTIVQEPAEATFPEMPRSAIEATEVDLVLPIDRMGAALISLTGEVAAPVPLPSELILESQLDVPAGDGRESLRRLGSQVPINCPDCGGSLWEVGKPHARGYRCYLGHAMSAQGLLISQKSELESTLWSAVRLFHERATTLDNLARDARDLALERSAGDYARRAGEARAQADQLRTFLLSLQTVSDIGPVEDEPLIAMHQE
jgi:two-component system, chemotaxis family, protein-glutamate methylesterase/glutaminase